MVLVEDVLTTGGTLLEGVRRAREAGRENLEAEALPLEAHFTRQQLLTT